MPFDGRGRENYVRFFAGWMRRCCDCQRPRRIEFEPWINSAERTRMLADYAESLVRARSETAIAALAILYADTNDALYSTDFKR